MGKTTADASLAPASAASSSSAASTGSRSPPRPAQPPSGSQGANPSDVAASGTERGGSASTGSKGKGKAQAADAERPTVKPDVGVTGPAAADDGAQDGPRPKKRRRRAALNCQECRRLKLKCSREVPCDQCLKRGCGDTCPDGKANRGEKADMHALQNRVAELEALLRTRPPANETAGSTLSTQTISPAMAPPAMPKRGPSLSAVSPQLVENKPPAPPRASPPGPEQDMARQNAALGASNFSDEDVEDERSFGTLIVDESGRHKWIGPRAGSEWLQEGTGEDGMATPFPAVPGQGGSDGSGDRWKEPGHAFPFTGPPALTLDECLAKVPSRSEARVLIEAYYRYSAYNYDPIRRSSFDEHVNAVYAALTARLPSNPTDLHPHRLALFFQVLATGCQFSLELSPTDPISDYYHGLGQCCLTLGHFMQKPTLAACQALHIMGHYLLTASPQSGGERAWPIWGIAMRCCIAMGLHRDGSKWDLEPKVNDERRLVFWESHTADLLQSSCYSRPNTLSVGTYDTLFPIDADAVEAGIEVGFSTLKFRLATLVNGHLSKLMQINPPTSYGAVTRLWHTIFDFEKNLPFHWRCRPAWEALISISGSPEEAVKTSPATDKHDLRLTTQRHVLALNIADAVLFLQRPYFTKALYEAPLNPCQSKYASSFLAVFERCLVTIRITQSMSTLYPAFTNRSWYWYYQSFTAAVCMSTITILAPRCPFATFALYELEAIISLFASAPEGSRPRSTLPALIKFLERGKERMTAESGDSNPPGGGDHFPAMASIFGAPAVGAEAVNEARKEEDQDHLALLGWTTRLVKSLKGKKRRGISISHLVDASGSSNGEPSPDSNFDSAAAGVAPPISDSDLASLSSTMSWFNSALPGDATLTGTSLQSDAAGSFPLPMDLGSSSSLSPNDPSETFDYNSIAQFNGIIPSNHDTYDNIEWDGLAAQFMLGSTSTAPPTTDDQHLPHF